MVFNVHITHILEKSSMDDFSVDMSTIDTHQQDITFVPEFADTQENSGLISLLKSRKNNSSLGGALQCNRERKYPIRIFTIQPEG